MIEFSHRLAASVVGFLVAAVALAGWRSQSQPVLRWGGIVCGLLVLAQIVLGGATVLSDLSANLVTAHLALATTLFATLLVLTTVSLVQSGTARGHESLVLRRQLFTAVAAVFALMMTGSYVSGSGAALAFSDWPLFDGSVLPGVARLDVIHATHRVAVLLVGAYLSHVALRAWRSQACTLVRVGPAIVLGLFFVQSLVGAANIWTELQPSAAAAHLAVAELLWAVLICAAAVAHLSIEPSIRERSVAAAPSRRVGIAAGEQP